MHISKINDSLLKLIITRAVIESFEFWIAKLGSVKNSRTQASFELKNLFD